MNLGILLAWEQVYRLKVKKDGLFRNEEEMLNFLREEKQLDEDTITFAYRFYDFANDNFSELQWKEVEELFQEFEQGRDSGDIGEKTRTVGKVLWEMGNLFGTNFPDYQKMN